MRLRIELSKLKDSAVVLRCTRPDGSETWQKQAKHGAFFALHDLTHFAVETSLGYRQGFFGLVADGWALEETTGKDERGPLPPETTEVETLVGLFDSERGSGVVWTLEEFNQSAPRLLSEAEMQAVRNRRSALFQRWRETAPGESMVLIFE